MVDLDQIQVHPLGDPINDCGCVAEFVGNWLGAQYYMFVNKEGERFVKEDGTRYEMSMAELEQTDGQMWLIVDSSQIAGDDSRTEQIESLIASGHSFKGESLCTTRSGRRHSKGSAGIGLIITGSYQLKVSQFYVL